MDDVYAVDLMPCYGTAIPNPAYGAVLLLTHEKLMKILKYDIYVIVYMTFMIIFVRIVQNAYLVSISEFENHNVPSN